MIHKSHSFHSERERAGIFPSTHTGGERERKKKKHARAHTQNIIFFSFKLPIKFMFYSQVPCSVSLSPIHGSDLLPDTAS